MPSERSLDPAPGVDHTPSTPGGADTTGHSIPYRMLTRRARRQLPPNSIREQIMDLIRNRPGITVTEIRSIQDFAWGTLDYHLKAMQFRGLIVRMKVGRRCLVYLPEAAHEVSKVSVARAAILRGDSARRIYDDITAHPNTTAREIESRTGLSYRAICYHVQRLTEAGLVESARSRGGTIRAKGRTA